MRLPLPTNSRSVPQERDVKEAILHADCSVCLAESPDSLYLRATLTLVQEYLVSRVGANRDLREEYRMISRCFDLVADREFLRITQRMLHTAARPLVSITLSFFGLVCLAQIAIAQTGAPAFNDVSNQTQMPIPGAGHDYQHLLGETVNLANGSVSFKISFPVTPSRGITLPYAWTYNSSSVSPLNMIDGNQPVWDDRIYQSGPTTDGWNTMDGIPYASLAVWRPSCVSR
jgi:hypothetical protein